MNKIKPHIDISNSINTIDIMLILFVILLTVLSVYLGNRQQKSSNKFLDHLLMGRQLSAPLFVATLVATWYGGIFGTTEIAFTEGVYSFVTQGFFWYIAYISFAIFIVPRICQSNAKTLPEMIGKMFGQRAAYIAAIFNIFKVLPVAYVISVGIWLDMVFNTGVFLGSIIGTTAVCLYSAWGGFRAVVFSDLVQFFFMCISVLLVVIFSIINFGGVDFLTSNLPTSYFIPTGTKGTTTTFIWGFIALATLVEPNFYQRCFAAKSKKTAQIGIFCSTIIWIIFDLCTTIGAMYAKAVIPSAASNNAYLIYSFQLLPSGFRGIFLAGILCTILSTLDSYLFIASNTLSYDLMPKQFRENLTIGHISTFIIGFISIVLTYFFGTSIESVWIIFGSYSAGCFLVPVCLGFFLQKKMTQSMFLGSVAFSFLAVTYCNIVGNFAIGEYVVDSLYMGMFFSILGVLTIYLLESAKYLSSYKIKT